METFALLTCLLSTSHFHQQPLISKTRRNTACDFQQMQGQSKEMDNTMQFPESHCTDSCGCHVQPPQTRWPKTTDIYSLTIVEMKKCKMKVSAGSVPSKGSGREPVPCLSLSFGRWLGIFGAPWLTAALLQLLPSLHMEFFPGCPVCPLSCPGDSHHWTEDLFHSRRTSS